MNFTNRSHHTQFNKATEGEWRCSDRPGTSQIYSVRLSSRPSESLKPVFMVTRGIRVYFMWLQVGFGVCRRGRLSFFAP